MSRCYCPDCYRNKKDSQKNLVFFCFFVFHLFCLMGTSFIWKSPLTAHFVSLTTESESNSDSDISGKKVKESKLLPSGSSKKEMTPRRVTKGPELLNTSTNHTATSCSPLNLQVIKTPTIVTSSSALAYHSSPGSSSYSLTSPLGNVD